MRLLLALHVVCGQFIRPEITTFSKTIPNAN